MAISPIIIFPAVGKPTHTYIERDKGINEKKLTGGLSNPGQICLLTGPSKTGKTSLYRQVLPNIKKQELIIRCSGKLTTSEFWASALENLDFSRLSESSTKWGLDLTTKIGTNGQAGWSWLAKVMASVGFNINASGEYLVKKEIINSQVNAKHLIPILKQMPVQLVVEDFHYLEDEAKVEVFQQWKSFIDEGVSVLVVSTTHHSVDIARANPDLSGRTRLIDIGKWEVEDLAKIPEKGFRLLDIKCSKHSAQSIARESVGLPIITQQICQEVSANRDMSPGSVKRRSGILAQDIDAAQQYVADNMYANHKADYDQLVAGPRQKKRKYPSYEKILASFALEPLKFSLSFSELCERVSSLCDEQSQIPIGSITSALKALTKFQEKRKMSILDWHENEKNLYIAEPSFLFYLRQKLDNNSPGGDVREQIIRLFDQIEISGGHIEIKMARHKKNK